MSRRINTLANYNKTKVEQNEICKILKDLYGKTSSEILRTYGNNKEYFDDIVDIARNIGIRLGSVDFTNLEKMDGFNSKGEILGVVRVEDEQLEITYTSNFYDQLEYKDVSKTEIKSELKKLQRFIIAHEIAYCCLQMKPKHPKYHIVYRRNIENRYNPTERAINVFASELLIPTKTLVKLLSFSFVRKMTLKLLSDSFCVPINVVKARLNHLKDLGILEELVFLDNLVIYKFVI